MRSVSVARMRALDRRTIEEAGISGERLMENAGRGVAEAVVRFYGSAAGVQFLAGRGNNGGDAFAAARRLAEWGRQTRVLLTCPAGTLAGDARIHFERMQAAGVPYEERPDGQDWSGDPEPLPPGTVLVDALLGTGAQGAPRGVAADAIAWLAARSGQAAGIVAIDLPSGLDGDTGAAPGAVVTADLTVTLGFPKRGLLAPEALPHTGCIEVADIGIPEAFLEPEEERSEPELLTAGEVAAWMPRRPYDSHKGRHGQVLLIGGAPGYAGAIALAARAALRSGAGLVSVIVPRSIAPIVAALAPEAMVHAGAGNDDGSLAFKDSDSWRSRAAAADAVLAGPGMTAHADTRRLLEALLENGAAPLAADADALNVFAGDIERLARARGPLVLTPHPGEMARLLGCSPEAVQADRRGTAASASRKTRAVIILKGAGTLVASPGQPLTLNTTGNAGMACGGMGDVLAGLLAGLLAQGIAPGEAAGAAAYLHGRAGDRAALEGSRAGLTAGDLVAALPAVLREVTDR